MGRAQPRWVKVLAESVGWASEPVPLRRRETKGDPALAEWRNW